MKNLGTPHVCVVLKRSSWSKWVDDERDPRITELIETRDESVRRMRAGHVDHGETVAEVRRAIDQLGARASWHDKPHDFRVEGPCDLVVTVGGDGTLLAASHGIGPELPLLGVNSSPRHSVGFFCAARKGAVKGAISAALRGRLGAISLARMRVDLNGQGLEERVLNEALFCHVSPAATSRYILRMLDERGRTAASEHQKSSGLWVGPAAGSTAAQHSAGGRVLPLTSSKLQYVVREPYRPRQVLPSMTRGLVDDGGALWVKSKMRQARVFLDGDHIAHDITIGDVLLFRRSDEPLTLLGVAARARQGEPRARGAHRRTHAPRR